MRSQIEHGTDRRAMHTAEVLQMAGALGVRPPELPYPERGHIQPPPRPLSKTTVLAGLAATGFLVAAGGIGWWMSRKNSRQTFLR